jgi:hypothetical protein
MRSPSVRRSVILFLIGAFMFALSSCNQAPQAENPHEPTLQITSTQNTFRKGEQFYFSLKIYSPEDSNVNIILGASKNLGLDQDRMQVTIAAGQTKTLELHGTPKRAGYYNITANATGTQWHEPAADMLGFNVATDNVSLANARAYAQTASGLESLETHLENLPKFTSAEEYAKLETAQTIDDAKDQDYIRLDSRLDNVSFTKLDGTKSEPFNTVLTYLPDTGSGQPRPEDLVPPTAAARAKAKATIRPQGFCGTGDSATVTAKIIYNGKSMLLPFTKISVFDENPWLAPSFVASGYTNAYGDFTFYKPWCDWGAWWDYSQPDLFFVIESLDSHEIAVWNQVGAIYNATYSARTGTNWDITSTSFTAELTANNSSGEHAIWLNRMVQAAQEFNVEAGGDGASYFPIRIMWPSRLDPRGWFASPYVSSFAPVAKLEILGPDWLYPYIAWHEFGHNLMYRTSAPNVYTAVYNTGYNSLTPPGFAWGSHGGYEQQNPELAYNEGFANYFYAMVQDHFGIYFNDIYVYPFRNCNSTSCSAHSVGNENELRVSTFLYRYTQEVLRPANNNISARQAYGKVRSALWNIGQYNLSFSTAWDTKIKATLPANSMFLNVTKSIANDTYLTLTGLPTP